MLHVSVRAHAGAQLGTVYLLLFVHSALVAAPVY
jgi:hypothetical protein